MRAASGPFLSFSSLLRAVVLLLAALSCALARAEEARPLRGVALIVGQSEYAPLPPLANPANDARDIEAMFDALGFDTTLVSDRDARRLARDLERFAEDAEDADVAVVYYAGHGVEAGGENYLVPVDADLSALEAAGEKLVPISDFLETLQRAVPLAIVLLDACRDNPFPADAMVRRDGAASPAVAIGAGGLGETRGATRLAAMAAPQAENFGTVIGFAAEPGKVALDGAAGQNSPYAAALLRHLDTMAGEEFGLVMRMIGEEVYLRTEGRQRPWVNESLRRQLFFGKAPAPLAGEDGDILAERRRLLVTIATLPSAQRARAETLAEAGGVSMSVVYAMMQALGIDPDEDPARVEDRLRARIEQFAALRAARQAFDSADPEITRLTALADRAEQEGALAAADALREQAKSRVAALRTTREEQIETLRRRIVEDAEVFSRSAETKELLFRHAAAADDYAEAAAMVSEWDAALAASLRNREIAARLADAELRGGAASLEVAEAAARTALATAGTGAEAARLRHLLGQTLMLRAQRLADPAALQEALAVQREAAAQADLLEPAERARILIDAGRAAGQSALSAGDLELLAQAEHSFTQAATVAHAAALHALRVEARFRIFQALYARWAAAPDAAVFMRLGAEVQHIMGLLDEGEPDAFSLRYAAGAIDIAFDMAQRINAPLAFATVSEMADLTLEMFDAERFPLIVARLDLLHGRVAFEQAERFGDRSGLDRAAASQRNSIRIYADAGTEALRREAEWHLALSLAAAGTREPLNETLAEALALVERLGGDPAVRANPAELAMVDFQRARLGGELAFRRGDEQGLRAALEAMQALRAAATAPVAVAQTAAELGRLHHRLGTLAGAVDDHRAAVRSLEEALALYEQWGADVANPVPYAELRAVHADAAAALAFAGGDPGGGKQ